MSVFMTLSRAVPPSTLGGCYSPDGRPTRSSDRADSSPGNIAVPKQELLPGCQLHPTRIAGQLAVALALLVVAGCGGDGSSGTATDATSPFTNTPPVQFSSGGASGIAETLNNIANLTVVSNDPDVLEAEYQAGFVQGHLQGRTIISARD